VKTILALSVLALVACHHKQTGPFLLVQSAPQAWTTVALTVAGSEADDNKRDSCLEEAQNAGIQIAQTAPVSGTLYFLGDNDYLEMQGAPHIPIAGMGNNAECKVALAKLTNLDALVVMTKGDPAGCQPTGNVEGSDAGFFHPGNYDAAVVEAQFKVRAAGGNKFVLDATRQVGNRMVVNGRGFVCH